MLVPESGRNSQSAWGPPCGEFISHISSFFFFNSRWLKIKQESRWKHNLLRMVWIVCFWPVSDLFLTSRGWFDSSILIQEKEKGREVLYITLKSWLLAAIQNLNLIWKEIIVSMSGSKPIKPVFLGSVSQHQSKAPIESAGSFLCKSLDTRMAALIMSRTSDAIWMDTWEKSVWKDNGLRMAWTVCFWPVSHLFLTCFPLSRNDSSILRKKTSSQIPSKKAGLSLTDHIQHSSTTSTTSTTSNDY